MSTPSRFDTCPFSNSKDDAFLHRTTKEFYEQYKEAYAYGGGDQWFLLPKEAERFRHDSIPANFTSCNLVGKGPGIDALDLQDCPCFAINQSVTVVERNPTYGRFNQPIAMIHQDPMQVDLSQSGSNVFQLASIQSLRRSVTTKQPSRLFFYAPGDYSGGRSDLTAIMALRILHSIGCKHVYMHGFEGTGGYAKALNMHESKPDRFKHHLILIKNEYLRLFGQDSFDREFPKPATPV